ncbi:uncharacterized protein METZ01_LOCUS284759, partial [marine metagenome]
SHCRMCDGVLSLSYEIRFTLRDVFRIGNTLVA